VEGHVAKSGLLPRRLEDEPELTSPEQASIRVLEQPCNRLITDESLKVLVAL
jgi:hypothetical protein